jgi:hypothetical protein
VTSVGVTSGVQWSAGPLSLQPYVRGQLGTLRQRSTLSPSVSQSFVGLGGGLIVVTRF